MLNYTKLPKELKELKQWVYATQSKIPINPVALTNAKINDPDTWGTFAQVSNKAYDHIGFVFTDTDQYIFIDLDECTNVEQLKFRDKVLTNFNSYTEKSMSGKGYHIICKGYIPNNIVNRRYKIEVYTAARYAVMTGDVVKDFKITECQIELDKLLAEIAPTYNNNLVDNLPSYTDEEVKAHCFATYGEKFQDLYIGLESQWESQSEADMSLLAQLCAISESNDQVTRLFRQSGLGTRDKAQRDDYIINAISKIRARLETNINLIDIIDIAKQVEFSLIVEEPLSDILQTMPAGMIKDITDFIYHASPRPVLEIAFAGALAFFSGLVARQYNFSHTGLNLYIILLAKTGTGKEAMSSGLDLILAQLRDTVPVVDDFVGPREFASGQALIRTLSTKPSIYCILGEFGYTLQELTNPKALGATIALKKSLLDLYQKSGYGNVLKSTAYADKEKTVSSVFSPCLTIVGESTPELFYETLVNSNMISDGLLTRFSLIEYEGDRPLRNKDPEIKLTTKLLAELNNLLTVVLSLKQLNQVVQPKITVEADNILDEFDLYCDRQITGSSEMTRQLWNRAHLKALKISALFAVSQSCSTPVITEEIALFAVEFVKNDVRRLLNKLDSNDYDTTDSYINDVICKFEMLSTANKVTKKFIPEILQTNLIPDYYIKDCLRNKSFFKNHKLGADKAILTAVIEAVHKGILIPMEPSQIEKKNIKVNGNKHYIAGSNYKRPVIKKRRI